MNQPVLPKVIQVGDLEDLYRNASAGKEKVKMGFVLLKSCLYTQPQRASELIGELENTASEDEQIEILRSKGVLANLNGDYQQAYHSFNGVQALCSKPFPFNIYLDMAGLAMNQGDWQRAEKLLEEVASHHPKIRNNQRFQLAIRSGFLHFHKNQWSQALTQFMQAERLLPTLNQPQSWEDLDFQTLLFSGMGELYLASGERELARLAFKKALHLAEQYQLKHRLGWLYFSAGNAALALDRLDEAGEYYKKAEINALPTQRAVKAGSLANLGFILMKKNVIDQASDYLDRAEAMYHSPPVDKKNLANIYAWRARIESTRNARKAVMQNYIQASEFARDIQDNRLLATICKDIAQYFYGQKDYKNAFDYLMLYDELAEKSREEHQQQRLMELQVEYETEQVEKEAENLRAQALDLQLQAMRAQMNPHFLFNALNGIQSFIHSENSDMASRYLAKFAGLVRQALNLSNSDLITLEEEVSFIKDYLFINQKLRFEGKLEYKVVIDEELDEDRIVVPPMMIQPFVENAIEHGFLRRKKGMVEIIITENEAEGIICCTIKDNGIGRKAAIDIRAEDPTRKEHTSMGMQITSDRLELLNRSGFPGHRVVITDMEDEDGSPLGTKVDLYFPVRRKQG
jgi:two-component system, LytTR family, sensor kinase